MISEILNDPNYKINLLLPRLNNLSTKKAHDLVKKLAYKDKDFFLIEEFYTVPKLGLEGDLEKINSFESFIYITDLYDNALRNAGHPSFWNYNIDDFPSIVSKDKLILYYKLLKYKNDINEFYLWDNIESVTDDEEQILNESICILHNSTRKLTDREKQYISAKYRNYYLDLFGYYHVYNNNDNIQIPLIIEKELYIKYKFLYDLSQKLAINNKKLVYKYAKSNILNLAHILASNFYISIRNTGNNGNILSKLTADQAILYAKFITDYILDLFDYKKIWNIDNINLDILIN